MRIEIQPVVKTFDSLIISNIQVSVNNDAMVQAFLEGQTQDNEIFNLYMDSETYSGWGSNDEYVVDWVLNQLGLQKK